MRRRYPENTAALASRRTDSRQNLVQLPMGGAVRSKAKYYGIFTTEESPPVPVSSWRAARCEGPGTEDRPLKAAPRYRRPFVETA
jgi:hypothetical protein